MNTALRYRLVVVPWDSDLDEHQAVDVGREMASVIERLELFVNDQLANQDDLESLMFEPYLRYLMME